MNVDCRDTGANDYAPAHKQHARNHTTTWVHNALCALPAPAYPAPAPKAPVLSEASTVPGSHTERAAGTDVEAAGNDASAAFCRAPNGGSSHA